MVSRIRTLLLVMLAIAAGLPALSNAETHGSTGAVFVMTNAASGNEIIAYGRNADGSLQQGRRFATGGRGSGGVTDPLASQGSLTLTEDRSFLLAVNAGSGSISVFRVHGDRLSLVDRVPCGGSEPVAVAQHGNLVYVLNAGGTSNVIGFRLERSGRLRPIATFHRIPHHQQLRTGFIVVQSRRSVSTGDGEAQQPNRRLPCPTGRHTRPHRCDSCRGPRHVRGCVRAERSGTGIGNRAGRREQCLSHFIVCGTSQRNTLTY